MSTSGAAPSGGPPSGAAGGDLGGVYPAPSVVGVQGRGVSATAPTDTQGLIWNNALGLWVPTSIAVPAASNLVTGPDAFGAAPVVGAAATFSRGDHNHGLPANPTPAFAAPTIVLGTVAAAGVAGTIIRSDATLAAFDATVPVTQAFGDAAATGAAAVTARRDHVHGMPANPAPAASNLVTGPDAFGAAPVVGTGVTFSRGDHNHGLPAQPAFLHGAVILRVHLATATNLADNTNAVIPFDTVDEDTAGVWSGTNHNYPVPAAGLYLVAVTASWGVSGATNPTLTLQIAKGGVATHEGPQIVPSSTRANAIGATAMVRCAANDALSVIAWENSGAAMAYNTGSDLTYMHIVRVSD